VAGVAGALALLDAAAERGAALDDDVDSSSADDGIEIGDGRTSAAAVRTKYVSDDDAGAVLLTILR
jgi:hypothetical protein